MFISKKAIAAIIAVAATSMPLMEASSSPSSLRGGNQVEVGSRNLSNTCHIYTTSVGQYDGTGTAYYTKIAQIELTESLPDSVTVPQDVSDPDPNKD